MLGNVALFWVPLLQSYLSGNMLWLVGLAVILVGLGLFRFLGQHKLWRSLPWNIAIIGLSVLGTLFMVLGQLYALALCLYLLMVLATAAGHALPRLLLVALVPVALALVAAAVVPESGVTAYLLDPNQQIVFPYLAQMLVKYPVLLLLALSAPLFAEHRFATTWLRDAANDTDQRAIVIRSLALFAVLNMFAFGLFGRWYEDRYLVHTYPFLLVLASYTLVVMADRFMSWRGAVNLWLPGLAAVVLLSVLMPHHLLQGALAGAIREHGDTNIENGRYFPDHASVGKFVRARLQPGDVVVATDVLQQRWYVGQADYWLRSANDVSIYVYRGADDRVRDIYVNAEHLNAEIAADLLSSGQRIWLIVSSVDVGEAWAFSQVEQDFIATMAERGTELYTGRDGKARVYLLGAGE